MRGVKGSGKLKDKTVLKQNRELKKPDRKYSGGVVRVVSQGVVKEPVGKVAKEVKMTSAKIGDLTEPMTVSIGARATMRVGDHEFLSPDISFNNIDPNGDVDKQIADGLKTIDKAWAAIIKEMHAKVGVFLEEIQK